MLPIHEKKNYNVKYKGKSSFLKGIFGWQVDLYSVLVFMLVFKEKWRFNLKLNTIHIQIIRE
jgi:hypothetical protein